MASPEGTGGNRNYTCPDLFFSKKSSQFMFDQGQDLKKKRQDKTRLKARNGTESMEFKYRFGKIQK